jgi:hypothetical protein
MPSLAVLFIIGVTGMKRYALHAQDLFRGNDVPCVLEDNISRKKIKRAGRIRLVAGYRTRVTFA